MLVTPDVSGRRGQLAAKPCRGLFQPPLWWWKARVQRRVLPAEGEKDSSSYGRGRNRAAKFWDSWKKPSTRIVLSSLPTPVALVSTGGAFAMLPPGKRPHPNPSFPPRAPNVLPTADLFLFYLFLWGFCRAEPCLYRLPWTEGVCSSLMPPNFLGSCPGCSIPLAVDVQAPPGKRPALCRNGTAPGKNALCCFGVLKKCDYFYSNFPSILGRKENVKGNLFLLLFFES